MFNTATATALFLVLFIAFLAIPFAYKKYRDYMTTGLVTVVKTTKDVAPLEESSMVGKTASDIKQKMKSSKKLQKFFFVVAVMLSGQAFNYLWFYLYQNYNIMIFDFTPTLPNGFLNVIILLSIPFYFLYFKEGVKADRYSKMLKQL